MPYQALQDPAWRRRNLDPALFPEIDIPQPPPFVDVPIPDVSLQAGMERAVPQASPKTVTFGLPRPGAVPQEQPPMAPPMEQPAGPPVVEPPVRDYSAMQRAAAGEAAPPALRRRGPWHQVLAGLAGMTRITQGLAPGLMYHDYDEYQRVKQETERLKAEAGAESDLAKLQQADSRNQLDASQQAYMGPYYAAQAKKLSREEAGGLSGSEMLRAYTGGLRPATPGAEGAVEIEGKWFFLPEDDSRLKWDPTAQRFIEAPNEQFPQGRALLPEGLPDRPRTGGPQPDLFRTPEGGLTWVTPGDPIPPGYSPYEKPSASGSDRAPATNELLMQLATIQAGPGAPQEKVLEQWNQLRRASSGGEIDFQDIMAVYMAGSLARSDGPLAQDPIVQQMLEAFRRQQAQRAGGVPGSPAAPSRTGIALPPPAPRIPGPAEAPVEAAPVAERYVAPNGKTYTLEAIGAAAAAAGEGVQDFIESRGLTPAR